jgi:hypothetical protein
MGRILKIKADNTDILVESSDVAESGQELVQVMGIKDVKNELGKLLEIINPISKSIINSIEKLDKKPNSVTAEFGLKFGVEGGLTFAKASAEAGLTVSLTWNQPTSKAAARGISKTSSIARSRLQPSARKT